MVTGGTIGGLQNLDSTELLKPQSSAWEVISGGELTSPRRGLRAATLNNKIFVTGTNKQDYIYRWFYFTLIYTFNWILILNNYIIVVIKMQV